MKENSIESTTPYGQKLHSVSPCDLRWRTHGPELAEEDAHRAALVVENARLYRELQEASHRKDEFLAMLGHELRNPLAPIRSSMEILRLKSVADPELQEVTEVVERQIQQLTRLIDDLLDVSRVGHGKINLQLQTVDLKDVVAMAVEISRPLISARKHVLEVFLPRQAVACGGRLWPACPGRVQPAQ